EIAVAARRAEHRLGYVALRDPDDGAVGDALRGADRDLTAIEERERTRASERVLRRAHHRGQRRRGTVAGLHHREKAAGDRPMLREPELAAIAAHVDAH